MHSPVSENNFPIFQRLYLVALIITWVRKHTHTLFPGPQHFLSVLWANAAVWLESHHFNISSFHLNCQANLNPFPPQSIQLYSHPVTDIITSVLFVPLISLPYCSGSFSLFPRSLVETFSILLSPSPPLSLHFQQIIIFLNGKLFKKQRPRERSIPLAGSLYTDTD